MEHTWALQVGTAFSLVKHMAVKQLFDCRLHHARAYVSHWSTQNLLQSSYAPYWKMVYLPNLDVLYGTYQTVLFPVHFVGATWSTKCRLSLFFRSQKFFSEISEPEPTITEIICLNYFPNMQRAFGKFGSHCGAECVSCVSRLTNVGHLKLSPNKPQTKFS